MYHCLQRKPVNYRRRLVNSVPHFYSISRNVDKVCLSSVCVCVRTCTRNVPKAISSTIKAQRQENAVNDRGIFRCICFDISDSDSWGIVRSNFFLAFQFVCSHLRATLVIADIVRLYNSDAI